MFPNKVIEIGKNLTSSALGIPIKENDKVIKTLEVKNLNQIIHGYDTHDDPIIETITHL